MYHTGLNTLEGIRREGGERVTTVKSAKQRRLHKAFLRYHDADNWPMLREALVAMGRRDLIGAGPNQLIPWQQPAGWKPRVPDRKSEPRTPDRKSEPRQGKPRSSEPRSVPSAPPKGRMLTQHSGLPPRDDGSRPRSRTAMVESAPDGNRRARRR